MSLIDDFIGYLEELDGDYVLDEQAEKFITTRLEIDEAEVVAFMLERAPTILTSLARNRLNKGRHHVPSVFDDARNDVVETLKSHGDDDSGPDPWTRRFTVSDDRLRRKACEMTGDDHKYVAGKYGDTARRSKLYESFHLKIAKQLKPGETTADVMTPEEYREAINRIEG